MKHPEVQDWPKDPLAFDRDVPDDHKGRFLIDQSALAMQIAPRDLVDYILDEIEKPPQQHCKCGTPTDLGPEGRPR